MVHRVRCMDDPPPSAEPSLPAGPPQGEPSGSPLPPPDAAPAPRPSDPARARGTRLGRALTLLLGAIFVFAAGTAVGRTIGPPSEASGPAPTASAAPSGATVNATPATSPDFGLIQQAYSILQQNYVDPTAIDPTTLIQGAIKGMADSLNDTGHTTYLTSDELQARNQSLAGTFVGIGAVLDTSANGAVIVRILPNSPAEKAGLKAGEIIATVDGQSVSGLAVDQIVTKVRGPEGTPVTLGLTEPDGSQRTLTITRAKLDLPLVSWAFAPGTHVAVVRLESFSTGASKALKTAITAAEGQGATALALDLRGNPGGFVNEAISVASQFLPSGVVYVSQDRSGTQVPHPVEGGGEATTIPLAVLVDGQTASAAEIVTGALQDAGRGPIIGEKTFGTGTVVGTFQLRDGSALTIGTERWFTPKGRAIWREGLVPDKTVALATGVSYLTPDLFSSLGSGGLAAAKDTQLQAAVAALTQGQATVPTAP